MQSFLIRGAMVMDGSGRPPFRANVAIENDQIRSIGPEARESAEQAVEAGGLILAPGFIDIHSHTDGTIFKHPLSESKILQGVTTEVVGNCGSGPERVLIASLGSSGSAGLSGKTIGQIAALWNCPPEEAVIRLLLREKANAMAVYFSLSEKDVETIMASEQVAVGSDGQGMNADEDAAATAHPRSYGAFVRVLGQYARE